MEALIEGQDPAPSQGQDQGEDVVDDHCDDPDDGAAGALVRVA